MSTDSRESRDDRTAPWALPGFSWITYFLLGEKEFVKTSLSRFHVNLTGSSPKASHIMVTLSETRALRDSKFLAKWAGVWTRTNTDRDRTEPMLLEDPQTYSPSSAFSASRITRDPFSKTWTCGPLTIPTKSLVMSGWRIPKLFVLAFFHWWIGIGNPWVWQSMMRFRPWRTVCSPFGSKTHFGPAVQSWKHEVRRRGSRNGRGKEHTRHESRYRRFVETSLRSSFNDFSVWQK